MDIKVCISIEFLEVLVKFDRGIQEKIVDFFQKYINDPKSSSIDFKKISGLDDKQLYRVKIDDNYRGIIYLDKETKIYHLLWVGNHDEARQEYKNYASKKVKAGSINIETKKFYEDIGISNSSQQNLFSSISKAHLLYLGINESDIPIIKNIKNSVELLKLKNENIISNFAFSHLQMYDSDFKLNEIKSYKNMKMKEFINLLYTEVLKPGIDDKSLDQNIRNSLENTYERIKSKKNLSEIIDFYYDALLSIHGKQIAQYLHDNGMNNFEKIREKVEAFIESYL